jgi:hypothetical protein
MPSSPLTTRPARHRALSSLALAILLVGTVGACAELDQGEKAVEVPGGGTVPIGVADGEAEARFLVPFDLSGSGEAERSRYLTWLASVIAPRAAEANASVTVYGVRESTSDYTVLASGTFAFDTDNPKRIEDETTLLAQRLVDDVAAAAGGLETTLTNITATLRQAGDIIAGDADLPTTVYFLSDGVSSAPAHCDLEALYAASPGPDPAAVAQDCIGDDPIDLQGATVHVYGAASSIGGDISDTLVSASEAVFWAMVDRAHGLRGQWTPDPTS